MPPRATISQINHRYVVPMTTSALFSGDQAPSETVTFEPTRTAGLERLDKFVSRTGAHYASLRNYDFWRQNRSSVSALSPWIRHRLITEEEVLAATLAHHSPSAVMKFIQEVFWRSYFKGWLEQHPSVWSSYKSGLQTALGTLEANAAVRSDYSDATAGRTGIACFDQWCADLQETGYLHNHARMWFASIWIFTLRLPWELGADFFLRHLLDGDPASNTLSWRWVAGLHTKGKTYLAQPSNIAKFTSGRFEPTGQLATHADPLVEHVDHPPVPLPQLKPLSAERHLLLITPEDCHPESTEQGSPAGVIGLVPASRRQSDRVAAFQKSAVEDAVARSNGTGAVHVAESDWAEIIIDRAERAETTHVVTPWTPVGPVASKLKAVRAQLEAAGLHLHQKQRAYDTQTWPHANKGFFRLKKKIPIILNELGLVTS